MGNFRSVWQLHGPWKTLAPGMRASFTHSTTESILKGIQGFVNAHGRDMAKEVGGGMDHCGGNEGSPK